MKPAREWVKEWNKGEGGPFLEDKVKEVQKDAFLYALIILQFVLYNTIINSIAARVQEQYLSKATLDLYDRLKIMLNEILVEKLK